MIVTSKIGFGEKVIGEAVVLPEGVRSHDLSFDLEGEIAIFLGSVSREIIEKARFVGVLGVVVPEIHFRDYNYFQNLGDFAMIVVQRFGSEPLSDDLRDKVSKLAGHKVQMSGEAHELKII